MQQSASEQQLAESDYLRELRYEYVELSGVQVTLNTARLPESAMCQAICIGNHNPSFDRFKT